MSEVKRKIWGWIKQNKAPLIVFILYMVITLVAVLFHENWEDEAQAWLTARGCSPIELIDRMGIEGHFMPWYLILMPFAKLGFPYQTMNIVSWLITGTSAWLMLKHLPCKFYKRVIFIFTFPMIYLNPVISRCYCLLPLGTILAIMFYKDRFKKPLRYLFSIFIIANVHTHTFAFALVMGIEYLVDWLKVRKKLDKKQNARIMSGIAGTVLLTGLSCLPLLGSVGFSSRATSGQQISLYQNPLKELFVYTPIKMFQLFSAPFPVLAYICATFLVVWEFFTRKKEFFKIAFATVWQWVICCFVFATILPQRVMIILFIILFFVSCRKWRAKEEGLFSKSAQKPFNVLANLVFILITVYIVIDTGNTNLAFLTLFSTSLFLLILFARYKKKTTKQKIQKSGQIIAKVALIFLALTNVGLGMEWVWHDIEKPFSDASATAKYINENIDDNSIFITAQEPFIIFSAIIPNLRVQQNRFYDVRRRTFYTFALNPTPNRRWGWALNDTPWDEYCHWGRELYYIDLSEQIYGEDIFDSDQSTAPASELKKKGILTKIFDISEGYPAGEHFTIYRVNPDICISNGT